MPFTIDHAAAKKQMFYDPSKPQEKVPEVLPENWMGTSTRGLPVREIPFWEFPKVVYLHPNRPFRELEHRNHNYEVVGVETVAAEHLTRAVSCEAHKNGGPKDCKDCLKSLEAALGEGWSERPYLPQPPPKKDEDLYGPRSKK